MAKKLKEVKPSIDDKYKDRIENLSTKDTAVIEGINLNLETIDGAILYYMNNIMSPQIEQNNQTIAVPTIVGNQEAWASIQTDGVYRDKNEKLLVPVIVVVRDNIDPSTLITNKINPNNPQNSFTYSQTYSKKNPYNQFTARFVPEVEYYQITVPDYIKLSYSGVILTNYMSNMNKIIESLIYANNSYWKGEDGYSFRVKIDNITNSTENDVEGERIVKSEFTMNVDGYLLPSDTYQRRLNQKDIGLSIQKISFSDVSVPIK